MKREITGHKRVRRTHVVVWYEQRYFSEACERKNQDLTVLNTTLYELGGRKTFQRAAMVTFHAVSCSEKLV